MLKINNFLDQLYDDRRSTIEEQVRSIDRDLEAREQLKNSKIDSLTAQLKAFRSQVLRLLPEHENAADLNRRERSSLEFQVQALERELQEERHSAWRDIRQLHQERRILTREYREEAQRKERLTK